MITLLMHGTPSHIAQHASSDWLDQLRNGIPQFVMVDGQRTETDPLTISFQCLGCSRILHSGDVTDGETYEEGE